MIEAGDVEGIRGALARTHAARHQDPIVEVVTVHRQDGSAAGRLIVQLRDQRLRQRRFAGPGRARNGSQAARRVAALAHYLKNAREIELFRIAHRRLNPGRCFVQSRRTDAYFRILGRVSGGNAGMGALAGFGTGLVAGPSSR